MKITQSDFGTVENKAVSLYTIENSNGVTLAITNYGATIVSLDVPDRSGNSDDIVLGHDNVASYIKDSSYFGCVIGRVANRTAGSKIIVDDVEYPLSNNEGANHLHGGIKGFDKVIWDASFVETADSAGLKCTYLSKDGEEGYPGNLSCTILYILTEDNEFKVEYQATTDKATPVNLTNHSYFNLAGHGNGNVLDHSIIINAERFTPFGDGLIPTGEYRSVANTPLDFRTATVIGARIDTGDEQLKTTDGYDNNWVFDNDDGTLILAATVTEPNSGRVMEVWTNKPAMQLYTANHLDGSTIGKQGKVYRQYQGFCLETQFPPNSPNEPQFPDITLRPGQRYEYTTIFKFSTVS